MISGKASRSYNITRKTFSSQRDLSSRLGGGCYMHWVVELKVTVGSRRKLAVLKSQEFRAD